MKAQVSPSEKSFKISVFPLSILANESFVAWLKIILGSCFLGICAQIKIPLGFTPIPFTIQTTAVMLIGIHLGSKNGLMAILLYLAQGCLGLPVWAGGGGGIIHFFGPSGGYLIAYLLQVYLAGLFFQRNVFSVLKASTTLLFSILFQLGIGTLWLACYVGIKKCLLLGFFPFIGSEIIKGALIIFYLKSKRGKSL